MLASGCWECSSAGWRPPATRHLHGLHAGLTELLRHLYPRDQEPGSCDRSVSEKTNSKLRETVPCYRYNADIRRHRNLHPPGGQGEGRNWPGTVCVPPLQADCHLSPGVSGGLGIVLSPGVSGELGSVLSPGVSGGLGIVLSPRVKGEPSSVLSPGVKGEPCSVLSSGVSGKLDGVLSPGVSGELSSVLSPGVSGELSSVVSSGVRGEPSRHSVSTQRHQTA